MTAMSRIRDANKLQRSVCIAPTVADVMASNPVSIGHTARIREAAALLSNRGVSAAPVINEAGQPVGIVSQTDIVRRAGGELGSSRCAFFCDDCCSLTVVSRGMNSEELEPGTCGCPLVRDIMTSDVYSIEMNASIARAVDELLSMNVNQLFVVDTDGALVGAVTAIDILRALRR